MRFLKCVKGIVFVLFFSTAFLTSSWAYLPPSEFILKSWLGKHSGVKGMRVTSVVTAYDQDKPSPVRFTETTFVDFSSGKLRSWATDSADKKLYGVEKSIGQLSPMGMMLLSIDLKESVDALKKLNIPILTEQDLSPFKTQMERVQAEKTFLSRLQGKVAWVIGSDSAPQAWFEKDTFFPIQFAFSQEGNGLEIQFDLFRLFHQFPFPRMIQVRKAGGGVQFASQLNHLIFTGPEMQSSSHPTLGLTELGESAPRQVKDLIHSYYELMR